MTSTPRLYPVAVNESRMEVHSVTTCGVPQPPGRYTDGMNFKLLYRVVLDLVHSQTWVLMWVANFICPPTRQVDDIAP